MKSRRLEIFAFIAMVFAALALFFSLQGNSFAARNASLAQSPAASSAEQQGPAGQEAQAAAAAFPSTFNYQGMLRLADGTLASGAYTLTLTIYDQVTGGNNLHQETFTNVSVRDGIFNIVLGDAPGNPISANVFVQAPRFVGVKVNNDAEMAPRQRIHPVPWALQSTTAFTANQADTATTLVDPASVGALTVNGALNAKGDVAVSGDLGSLVVRDAGTSANGTSSRQSYVRSLRRYVVEAADGGNAPYTVPVDDNMLIQLCGDLDGCQVTIGMRDWTSATVGKGDMATYGPYRFSVASTQPNGQRFWERRAQDGGSASGWDGNNGVDHVINAFDACYFTDAKYQAGNGSDPGLGFGLLNWHGGYDASDMTCFLIIDD